MEKLAWIAVLAGCIDVVEPMPTATGVGDLAQVAYGWNTELIAQVDQSYAGWDVEIGDADGDGRVEVLTGTAPDSQILQHAYRDGRWETAVIADQLSGEVPGMVLGVRVVDLDGDGRPEIIAGTGQEERSVAQLAILQWTGGAMGSFTSVRSPDNTSAFTHGLPTYDLDGNGTQEIVSSYCGNGEVIRYDVPAIGAPIESRKVLQMSGSGEDAALFDVDGDGWPELVVANAFRERDARVQIHDVDRVTGDPLAEPRIVLDSFEGRRMFYASFVHGDLDGDGHPELVVAWKAEQERNSATLVAYRIAGREATVAYVLARDDAALDMSYFEKMMAIADVDGDGRNELLLSTRGDGESEDIDSKHLGHVFLYRVVGPGDVRRDLLVDFDPAFAQSSWLAVGDVDDDQRPDVVIATGKGDREKAGRSWVLRVWRE